MIDVPVVSVAQAPHVQIVEKIVESSQMQIAEKTAEIPLLQIVKKTVETPEVQTVRCTQTSESLGNAPVCRSTLAETVEAVEIGVITPTESARPMFVTTPVLETPPVVAEYVQLAPAAVPQGDDARGVGARCRAEDVGFSTCPAHRQSPEHSRDGTDTGPIRSESSEDRGDASGAVLGRTRGHASHHTTSGAHDPERAEDCGGAADPVH